MYKKLYNILISILLINIIEINTSKLLDDTLSQFSYFTFGEQKYSVNDIPGRIAAKENISLTNVNSVGYKIFSISKPCDTLNKEDYPYTIVTGGYVKKSKSLKKKKKKKK